MIRELEIFSADVAWLRALNTVLNHGEQTTPRGSLTIEYPHLTSLIDMRHPVITVTDRKLNYRFMAAEAYWILSGDDSVEGVVPYNSQLLKFSDDGVTFDGAYGPHIAAQLDYVVNTLVLDPDSRQAGLTIWQPNPPRSKDIPCTVALWFQLRNKKLNVHAFMRSNDLWLGYPYDVFNFSMLGHLLVGLLNARGIECGVGVLFHTAVSAHLYAAHEQAATAIIHKGGLPVPPTRPVPALGPSDLMSLLAALREKGNEGQRWW